MRNAALCTGLNFHAPFFYIPLDINIQCAGPPLKCKSFAIALIRSGDLSILKKTAKLNFGTDLGRMRIRFEVTFCWHEPPHALAT